MRKKSKSSNHRKFRLGGAAKRRRDESEWIVLDAELPAPKPGPRQKSRRRAWIVRSLAVACLLVSLPLVFRWAHSRIFYQNEEFVLRQLSIQTDGTLPPAKLAEVANVAVGMNLMELDLSLIERQIAKLPVVEKVGVTREVPDRLNIVVHERLPIAWLSCPPLGIRPGDMERGFLMDEQGHLFRCLDLNEGMEALPVIEAFKLTEPREGTRIENDSVRAALRLISESDKLFEGGELAVHQVKCRNEWSIECVYRTGLSARFAIDRIEEGLTDLAIILEKTQEIGATLATANVAAVRNIPVTFAEPIDPSTISATAVPVQAADVSPEETRNEEQEKHLRSILKGG